MLMNLIGKDRQLEALVEKLCHRLRGASDERHCTDLSYCLTLVPYTDRTIQKLVDNIACFADKLNYAKLHKHLANIIIACKKQTKMNKVSSFSFDGSNRFWKARTPECCVFQQPWLNEIGTWLTWWRDCIIEILSWKSLLPLWNYYLISVELLSVSNFEIVLYL